MLQQILVTCRDASVQHESSLIPAAAGLLGAVVGAVASFGGVFFVQRRGSKTWLRWFTQAHFDLFQDVADCAGEYAEYGNFGSFAGRLSGRLKILSKSLHQDASAGLARENYALVYQSISAADYMLWVSNEGFGVEYQVSYINQCLSNMRAAQSRLGSMPATRPFTEGGLLDGTQVLSLEDNGKITVVDRADATPRSVTHKNPQHKNSVR
ncbi:MAG TPA: hypothetical protein VK814_00040 [Acidobacteriaceae bacterium]|jgi:hypothetical protein|nr:hypothetical protein [Acidobacteriaceae bacterium]